MLIDIGGGSVEVTIAEDKKVISTESYNMGTVRLLQKLNGEDQSIFSLATSKHPFSMLIREYAEAARRRIDRENRQCKSGRLRGDRRKCRGDGQAPPKAFQTR